MNKKDFKNSFLLISGNIVTVFGNIVLSNSLNLWIIQISGNVKVLGIASSITFIPILFFTLFGGIISDSFNKKNIVVICDFFSFILCFIMAILSTESTINIYIIVLFRFVLAIITSMFKPAIRSLPSCSISKDNRIKFNSYFSISENVVQIVSPAISGILMGLGLSIQLVLILDGVTFLVSSITEMFITCDNTVKLEKSKRISILSRITTAYRYIFLNFDLSCVIVLSSLFNIFIAGYNMFLPYYGSVMGKSYYGFLLSIEAIGGIVGTFSLRFNIFNFDKKIEVNLFLSVVLFNLFFITHNIYVLYGIVFVFGVFLTRFNVKFFTYLQNEVSKEFIGRVISITTVIALVLMPLGQIIFSNLIDFFGMITFAFIGASMCVLYIFYIIILKKIT